MQGCHTCTDHGSTLFLPQLHAHHAPGQQTSHFWGQSSCGAVCGAWRSFNGDLRHEKRGGPTKWAEAVALVLTRRLQRPHVPRQRHLLAFESLNRPRLTRADRQVATIQGLQAGQNQPYMLCVISDFLCAPLEKSPSARPAAAVAQQTTSRRLRRSWGQTSPEAGAVLEIRRGRPNAGERSAAMIGLVLRPGAGNGCVSLEMRHRLNVLLARRGENGV